MADEDPFELYKRRKAEQERAKRQGGGAAQPAKPKPPTRRPTASVPKPKPRPAVPGVRPKGETPKPAATPAAKPAAPRPAEDAPAKPRVVRHAFSKADLAKMGDDREFKVEPPKGLRKHAFHADDVAKMNTDNGELNEVVADGAPGDGSVEETPKARGLVRHKFDRGDLQKMGDDRNFEPAKPAGMHAGAFHDDDLAEMRQAQQAAEATGDAEVARPKGLRRHKFAKEALEQMSGERATDVPRPAGFESGRLGSGVRQPNYAEETDEEAAERRAREKGKGLFTSGITRKLPRHLDEDEVKPPPAADDDDGGDAPGPAA